MVTPAADLVQVVTLHGVGWHARGYATPLFDHLDRLRAGSPVQRVELHWPAWPRVLAWWALGVPRVMRRAQRGLDAVAARDASLVLVTHSAGCRIAYDWFTRRGRPAPIRAWISGGANAGILGGAAVPLGVTPAPLPEWTHVYRTGDPLGGPLAAYGARDVVIPPPLLGPHRGFWEDPGFARVVASRLPKTILPRPNPRWR